jgi:hypothetical protein
MRQLPAVLLLATLSAASCSPAAATLAVGGGLLTAGAITRGVACATCKDAKSASTVMIVFGVIVTIIGVGVFYEQAIDAH